MKLTAIAGEVRAKSRRQIATPGSTRPAQLQTRRTPDAAQTEEWDVLTGRIGFCEHGRRCMLLIHASARPLDSCPPSVVDVVDDSFEHGESGGFQGGIIMSVAGNWGRPSPWTATEKLELASDLALKSCEISLGGSTCYPRHSISGACD